MGAPVADDPEMKPLRCSLQTRVWFSAACCASVWGQHAETCPRIMCSPCWGSPQSSPLRMKSFLS